MVIQNLLYHLLYIFQQFKVMLLPKYKRSYFLLLKSVYITHQLLHF